MNKIFVKNCVSNNLVFTELDYLNFCKACHVKPEKLNVDYIINDDYVMRKNLLGPCIFHPRTTVKPEYNISKIIKELQLDKQSISEEDKMKKIVDYIKLLG
jgi:ABC-type antimicrobial peptide transport system ATPase subunit